MKRGLLFSFIAAAMLIATSAGANVKSLFDGASDKTDRASLRKSTARRAFSINANSYRSPGHSRKVIIESTDAASLNEVSSRGAVEIADYGSFKLFVIDNAALENAQAAIQSQSNEDSPIRAFTVRDDFNVLLLRAGAIDTTAEDAPGNFIGLGRASGETVQGAGAGGQRSGKNGSVTAQTHDPRSLPPANSEFRLIQFIGPVKREWLKQLRRFNIDVIAYVPNNAYLVRGSESNVASLMYTATANDSFIQWEGPFADEYKIHPALVDAMNDKAAGEVTIAVQFARSQRGIEKDDVSAAKRMAASVIGDAYTVLGFTNLRMKVEAKKIAALAALANVINIEPWSPPQMMDERADQIIASDLTDDNKEARGPGYLQWLAAHGFASRFNFAIDVADGGIDRGFTTPDKLHPDFLDANKQSRVVYARDYTSELDPGDVAGHGTINLSIAGGASISADKDMRDSKGFNYGLGVAPFALLGSSKIFQSSGKFDLIEPFTKLISEAYRDGARISSNSWGAFANSYTLDAQEYDARARDAVPSQAGNQEMVMCFAAGNSGLARTIISPSTAKNVISVAASENSRKDGVDGCAVRDTDADNALDIAFFSSEGPLDDGRIKPDIAAPGTHVQGAASQHPDFDGSGICGEKLDSPYFPVGQKLYTWSSGTSHSTPAVAGAAALARQFFLSRGEEPSAALIKALLLNTTTYMTGELAGGNLPQSRQGWGLLNLNRAFDATPKIFVNQTSTLNDSGQEFVLTGEVKDSTKPFRVTLAWSDAPGFSGAAPWVNDLDLEVTINGQVYRGNNFKGEESQPGGEPDTKNNVEGVWLPAGTIGTFVVRVKASNIAGDAVPGNGDSSDQDFALVVYNGERKDAPVAAVANITLAGGADAFADPGETVSMRITIADVSPIAMTGARGVLNSKANGVSVTVNAADFPNIAAGATGESLSAFSFTIDRSVSCGSAIQFVIDVTANGLVSRVPFTVRVGSAQSIELFADDIESGEAKWTHGSLVKKKKNRIETWTIATKRFHSGGSSWFSSDLGKATNSFLATVPIQLPSDGRNLQLVFYHTFEFEQGSFDGGVLEISTGGDFEDLGPKIIRGGYNGQVNDFTTSNALAGRDAWVEGRLGQFQQVVVDLSSYAGKTVTIRFRIGTDSSGKGLGWYVDDVVLKGERVSCAPAAMAQ